MSKTTPSTPSKPSPSDKAVREEALRLIAEIKRKQQQRQQPCKQPR